jgi:hypothetical protein
MIGLLRVLRAVFGVSGVLNIIDVLYELMFHPSPNSPLAATIDALWVAACGVLICMAPISNKLATYPEAWRNTPQVT